MATEEVGLDVVILGMAEFVQKARAYTANVAKMTAETIKSALHLNFFQEIAKGALREIGALATRGLVQAGRAALRFAEDILQAAMKGTALEKSLATVQRSLVEVARTSLAPFFDSLAQMVDQAAPKFLGLAQVAGEALGGLGQRALEWGRGVAGSFAQGLIDGAAAVLDALIYLGNLIASWLMPGSPPKLLPDLDDWGRGAMEAYLEGWTKASFSTFREIAGTLETFLRSLSTGSDTALMPRILGTREAIAQAVEQARQVGRVTDEALQQIFDAAGAANENVRAYLRSVFDLEAADANLAAAQKELNSAVERYNELLRPLEERLAGITEEQQQLTEEGRISQLRLVARDPNATAAEKRMAALEIEKILAERSRRALLAEQKTVVDAAQAKVDAAAEAKAAAEAEFQRQQAAVQLLAEQNALIKEQIALLERLAGAGGAGPKPAGRGGPLGGIVKPDMEWIEELKEKLQPLIDKFNELKSTWADVWARFLAVTEPARNFVSTELIPLFQELWRILKVEGGESMRIIRQHWDEKTGPMLRSMWEWTKDKVNPALEKMWEWIKLIAAWNAIAATNWTDKFMPALLDFTDWWLIHGFLAFAQLVNFLVNLPQTIAAVAQAWVDFRDTFVTKLDEVMKAVTEIDWEGVGRDIIAGMVAGVVGEAQRLVDAVVAAVSGALAAAQGLLGAAASGAPAAGGSGSIAAPAAAGPGGGNVTNAPSYNLTVNTNRQAGSVASEFTVMQVLHGGAQ